MDNKRAWDSYDSWLLKGSGVDDPNYEVFKVENHELYSMNEDSVNTFEDKILLVKVGSYCKDSYDSFDEYYDECFHNLVDELELFDSECDAIQSYLEDKQDDHNEAMGRKYEERKELRSSNEQ